MVPTAGSVDTDIAGRAGDAREVLERVRARLLATVPDPGETISYQMPTITMDGRALLYGAAWKQHLGLYAAAFGDAGYEALVGPYRAAEDSVHFPYRTPFPDDVLDAHRRARRQPEAQRLIRARMTRPISRG